MHLLTGTVAGNIFGQASTYWRWIAPRNYRHGIITGLIVGAALWAVLFVPVTTFGIQPRLDSFSNSAPNQYVYDISSHFQSLYPVIVGGSLVFHLIYGSCIGIYSWTDERIRNLSKERHSSSDLSPDYEHRLTITLPLSVVH